MKTWKRVASALVLSLSASLALAEAIETRIIQSHRAQELAPILSPMVGPNGSISVYQGQLIIRASAENHAQITQVLKDLDRPLRNVQISVRRAQSAQQQSQGAGVGIRGNRVQIGINNSQQQHNDRSIHTSRTVENSPTFIDTGSLVATPTVYRDAYGRIIRETHFQNAMQGFEATPQVLPNGSVRLSINYQYNSATRRSGMDTNQVDTVVVIPQGQWSTLGGIDQSSSYSGSGILSQQQSSSSSSMPFEVKVDVLD